MFGERRVRRYTIEVTLRWAESKGGGCKVKHKMI